MHLNLTGRLTWLNLMEKLRFDNEMKNKKIKEEIKIYYIQFNKKSKKICNQMAYINVISNVSLIGMETIIKYKLFHIYITNILLNRIEYLRALIREHVNRIE